MHWPSQAGITLRSAQRTEAGRRAGLDTVNRLAKAPDVQSRELLNEAPGAGRRE
jgi:hypothetical protein